MTCIVGLVDNGRVIIGGDSAGVTTSWGISTRRDPKVGLVGEFAIGFTDSFRMGQVLLYRFRPPELYHDTDLMPYMVGPFVDELRLTLKAAGYAECRNERESAGTFLVGIRGRLFRVCSDYQVGEAADKFDSVGCGEGHALGSLFTTSPDCPLYTTSLDYPLSARGRVIEALRAAEHFSGGVRSPFNLIETPVAVSPVAP